jgi:hypothetical protein
VHVQSVSVSLFSMRESASLFLMRGNRENINVMCVRVLARTLVHSL